jgi:uncharacterized protein
MRKIDRPTEIRSTAKPVEVRSGAPGRNIGGYAAVFDRNSQNLGGFIERVDYRAFNKTLGDGGPVICRFNHEDNLLLGTTRAGTLELSTDATGLLYEVDLPECRRDVFEMVARGDVANSSFSFIAYDDNWTAGPGGIPVRTLLSCKLIDVAPVTSPAYPDATVGLRSLAQFSGASYEEVADLRSRDELRKLFVRTDRPSDHNTGIGGTAALAQLIGKRYGPWDDVGHPPRSGCRALVEIQGRRWAAEGRG